MSDLLEPCAVKVARTVLRGKAGVATRFLPGGDHCYRVGEQGLLVHNASAALLSKLGIDLCDIEVDPSSTSGRVFRPKKRKKGAKVEVEIAEKIVAEVKDDIILALDPDQAGVDACFRSLDPPIQVKRISPIKPETCDICGGAGTLLDCTVSPAVDVICEECGGSGRVPASKQ